MNKFILRVFTLISMFLASLQSFAQQFTAVYDFAGANTTSGRTDPTPTPIVQGLNFGNFGAVAPTGNPNSMGANPNAAGRFSFTGWSKGATTGSDVFTGPIVTDQYYDVTITPENYYSLKLDSITFTIQRSGTGVRQYALRSGVDGYAANLTAAVFPANANLQVVNANTFQIADAATTAQAGSKIDLSASAAVTAPITFRFYGWYAESAAGTFSIDNVKFYGTSTLLATAPVISTSVSSLTLPATPANTTSPPLSYTVQANNLTNPLLITTSAPFSISATPNGTYETTISIPVADVANATSIYVKFAPVSANSFLGEITHTTTGATTKTISVSGDGIEATNTVFNFNSCTAGGTPGSGFTSYSVTGAQKWACSSFGFNSTNGVDINGFLGGPQENEDWLISPSLSLGGINLPVLRFWSRGQFVGPPLQLLISTDYDGSSDPNLATWTNLDGAFPPLTNTWALTDGIDLSAYKSFPAVFIAFKYTSSVELGAARWNIDDLDITNRTQLISTNPALLNFGEVTAGASSAGRSLYVKVIGYGDVTLTAPSGYQLSFDNITFTATLTILQANAEGGLTIYARFAPASKELKIEGRIKFVAAGLDSSRTTLTGTSYPRAETFDAGTYNLSFFGSNPTNNPTPEKITTQVNNIATVLQKLNLDVVGVQEVSNDDALNALVAKLPNRKATISNRWSYSFQGPDPNFPPQKTGFIYDTLTMHLVEARAMFAGLYDSARNGYPGKIPSYPGGAINFWASGRLPFLASFEATIKGVTKRVTIINIHAKSSSDAASYNRRVYDVRVLLDSINAYYKDENVIILGDYNDKVNGSTYSNSTSPFKGFVDDADNYNALTLPLDQAGKISYIGGSGLIDNIIISNELAGYNIANSTGIEDPRAYISGYSATSASDHLPVYSRFNFSMSLPVTLLNFNASLNNKQVLLKWATSTEFNNNYFEVERSADHQNYHSIGKIKGAGNSNRLNEYTSIDRAPLEGVNYYRLKQTDADGKFSYSKVIAVKFAGNGSSLSIFPNPVTNFVTLSFRPNAGNMVARLVDVNGRIVVQMSGDINGINQQLNAHLSKIPAGFYVLKLVDTQESFVVPFVKK